MNLERFASDSGSNEAWFKEADHRIICGFHTNVLLIGSREETAAFLTSFEPSLQRPITTREPDNSLEFMELPDSGTLILKEPATLCGDDQQRLFDWITAASETRRVISLSSISLLPFVARGTFFGALYYRLNTVCLDRIWATSSTAR
jgi:hypothetical protein